MNFFTNKNVALVALVGSLALISGKKQEVVDTLELPGVGTSLVLQTVLSTAPQAEILYKKIFLGDAFIILNPIIGIHFVVSLDLNGNIKELGRLILESDNNYYLIIGSERMFLSHDQAQEIIKKGMR